MVFAVIVAGYQAFHRLRIAAQATVSSMYAHDTPRGGRVIKAEGSAADRLAEGWSMRATKP